jgi:hypothetical protein
MELEFINQELSEARLYRASRSFGTLDGRDIADLLYLNTIATYMFSQDREQREFAQQYAKKTVMYGTYSLFRTHATDMYLLAYVTKHPDTDRVKLADPISSKKLLNDLNFDPRRHIDFLRKIAAAKETDTEATNYLYRLETQLQVKDARYKRWRRLITDWRHLKYSQKQLVISQLTQELRRRGAGAGKASEIMLALGPMLKVKRLEKPLSTASGSAAGALAGALAGRYAASKLNKMDNKTAKNVGTGIGAIAGYWAGGRGKVK